MTPPDASAGGPRNWATANPPHRCRDGHDPIGHWDSENEHCPLCRATASVDAYREDFLLVQKALADAQDEIRRLRATPPGDGAPDARDRAREIANVASRLRDLAESVEAIAAALPPARAATPSEDDDGMDASMAISGRTSRKIIAQATRAAATSSEIEGQDVAYWHESYGLLRDAVTEHLAPFIHEGEEAEEAILVDAIARAGAAATPEPGEVHE
jgi:hypothetical protein